MATVAHRLPVRGRRPYAGTRIPQPGPDDPEAGSAARGRPHRQLRPQPPVHARRAAADRRPARRARRRARRRDRLPAHRLREDDGAEDVVEGRHLSRPASTTSPSSTTSSSTCSRSRSCCSCRCRARRPGCGWRSASWCGSTRTSSTSAPPRSRSGRSRCSGTASASATSCSTSSRWSPGRACTRATSRSAASPRTSRPASTTRPASSASGCRRRSTSTRRSSTRTRSGSSGRSASALLSAEDAIALGQTGPNLRASGVDWDLRKREPYLAYDQVEFDVPVYEGGDVFDRYKVRVDEMRESVRIIEQCDRPARADAGRAVDRRRPQGRAAAARGAAHLDGVADPPLQDRHRGLPRPRGRGLRRVESPRGESGCTIVSDGTAKPWRVKFRAPSFAALHATAACCQDVAVADLIAVVGSLDAVMGDVDR